MFEKEAEEYATTGYDKKLLTKEQITVLKCGRYDGFQKGAEFGYNKAKEELEEKYKETICNSEMNLNSVTERLEELEKANEWHYVKDGDYPDTDRTVLAYSDDVVSEHYPYFAQYYKGFTNAKKKGVDLNWNCWRNNMQRELIEPTVWCEIPKFDKENTECSEKSGE